MEKKRKKNFIVTILVLLLITVQPVISQTLKTADLYFSGGAYYTAANMYRNLLNLRNKNTEIKSKRGEIMFKTGECYRKMNKIEDAKKWYLQAQGAGYEEADLYFGLGNIQMLEGKYSEAKILFKDAKDKNPQDKRIEAKIASCDLYVIYEKENGQYSVRPVEHLNTRGSEYGLSFYGDKLIFASTRVGSLKKEISDRTGLPYSDLYIASENSRSLYGKVEKLESVSDAKANEGTFCYDMQTGQLYCTRCETNNKNCYIVKIEEKNGKYKEGGKLKLGNHAYGVGHPYITDDGRRIYFTSVMEGGYGGADLWYVDRNENGEYGKPVNLGANINTPCDEVFPSFIDGILYFASDGHPGLGGLDLFASYIEDDGNFSKPFNLRAPFNSSWDDFNLVHHSKSSTGLFVSNRNNAESSDDIYIFDNFPPRFVISNGKAYDDETKEPLKDYTVLITEGNKKIYEQTIAGEDGYFVYLEPNKKYDIQITSQDYLLTKKSITTEGVKNFSELEINSYLPKDEIKLTIKDSEKVSIEMKDIFYEFDKFRLTESSKQELDKYVNYFIQYPNMAVEINSHTDSRGSSSYNKNLSEWRAKAVVEYFISKGINPNQISWKGYGKEQLRINNAHNEAEHQANRRTVFKVLTLGINNNENAEIPDISTVVAIDGVMDMSGWWIRIHKSVNNNQSDFSDIKKIQKVTGKEVQVIKCNDGLYHYCIRYSQYDEALRNQISLYKENIITELFQFKQ
ncbi:MAG: OmpA family protein [Prevotellaceae bacterium]|jgi:outer membrane protein OmpA-like peptidoglycan-associated protein/tetratricopeptide (TPR) repeat protein|nr:OmpA family protein [Prevotellaceae bacterium]